MPLNLQSSQILVKVYPINLRENRAVYQKLAETEPIVKINYLSKHRCYYYVFADKASLKNEILDDSGSVIESRFQ